MALSLCCLLLTSLCNQTLCVNNLPRQVISKMEIGQKIGTRTHGDTYLPKGQEEKEALECSRVYSHDQPK